MRLGRQVRWNPAAERILDDALAACMIDYPMRAPWSI